MFPGFTQRWRSLLAGSCAGESLSGTTQKRDGRYERSQRGFNLPPFIHCSTKGISRVRSLWTSPRSLLDGDPRCELFFVVRIRKIASLSIFQRISRQSTVPMRTSLFFMLILHALFAPREFGSDKGLHCMRAWSRRSMVQKWRMVAFLNLTIRAQFKILQMCRSVLEGPPR